MKSYQWLQRTVSARLWCLKPNPQFLLTCSRGSVRRLNKTSQNCFIKFKHSIRVGSPVFKLSVFLFSFFNWKWKNCEVILSFLFFSFRFFEEVVRRVNETNKLKFVSLSLLLLLRMCLRKENNFNSKSIEKKKNYWIQATTKIQKTSKYFKLFFSSHQMKSTASTLLFSLYSNYFFLLNMVELFNKALIFISVILLILSTAQN